MSNLGSFSIRQLYKSMLPLLLTFVFAFYGCESDDENDDKVNGISGQWILIEMLADPGDGSGEFIPVESEKSISFNDDRTFVSNGDICSFSTLADNPTEGTYSESENGYTIDCDTPFPSPLNLSIDEGDLIIAFSCIEPCLQKFRRLN